jgi:ankyrin repeat protein
MFEGTETIMTVMEQSKSSQPIFSACEAGTLEEVQRLVRANPGVVHAKLAVYGTTPLMKAAAWGHSPIVEFLLSLGTINLAVKDEFGLTALDWAIQERREEIAMLFFYDARLPEEERRKCQARCIRHEERVSEVAGFLGTLGMFGKDTSLPNEEPDSQSAAAAPAPAPKKSCSIS